MLYFLLFFGLFFAVFFGVFFALTSTVFVYPTSHVENQELPRSPPPKRQRTIFVSPDILRKDYRED